MKRNQQKLCEMMRNDGFNVSELLLSGNIKAAWVGSVALLSLQETMFSVHLHKILS